jgi:superoxide dismutase, Cu-Zn family
MVPAHSTVSEEVLVSRAWIGAAVLLPLCGPATAQSGETAKASLVDAKGATVGTATLTQTPSGVLVDLEVKGLLAGEHALHVHQVGQCDAAGGFKSAGDHFSVGTQKHGFMTEGGPHAGDMPNIFVGETGSARVELLQAGISLKDGATSVFDADGSALVIHANSDDHHSQPSGAAGDRIACGVIVR